MILHHVSWFTNYLPWKTERMLLTLRSRPGIEVTEKHDFYHNVVPSHFSLAMHAYHNNFLAVFNGTWSRKLIKNANSIVIYFSLDITLKQRQIIRFNHTSSHTTISVVYNLQRATI
jgi:hypothetical protein